MVKNNTYRIDSFFVGELYLYNNFGNLLSENVVLDGYTQMENLISSGAINFEQDQLSRYIDWFNKREYNGFLTIFYKQKDKYICLHNGISYTLNEPVIIDNLIPLTELLPKIDVKISPRITFEKSLYLFNLLFKQNIEESKLYTGKTFSSSEFLVGDLSLKKQTPIIPNESRITYIDLPQHIMLNSLELYNYENKNYIHTVYRCLFLKDGVDLYNINNNQFYNPYEDTLDSIISLEHYLQEYDIQPIEEELSIPKALRKFKKTL